jgi:hypothetical protein
MFEATWTMPLPPNFSDPLLTRGTLVEIMDGSYRIGSPLILASPERGAGLGDPWKFTATGVGREVEGADSWYCDDGAGNSTTVATDAITVAIGNGLQWGGYDPGSVPSFGFLGVTTQDDLQTIGSLLNAIGDFSGYHWGVGQDNLVAFTQDPTTPTYQVTPDVVALGTADDNYASTVKVRYIDSSTSLFTTATATDANTQARFGRREFAVDLTSSQPPMSSTAAQGFADGILAKSKGRLSWTNGLTLTSNEIQTIGGVPADLSLVAEDVGTGCMVRLHGIFDDLLEFTGNTWLDLIIGEAKYVDGASTIDLNPLGLAPRDLAAVVESVTGMAAA